HSARLIQFDNAFEMCASASNRRSQRRHIGTLWLWRLSTRGDEGGAAARFEHRERPLRHVAPNRVENGVAIGDLLREISGVVVDDEFVVACGDGTKVLELIEEALDEIALAIECEIAGSRRLAVGFRRYHRCD